MPRLLPTEDIEGHGGHMCDGACSTHSGWQGWMDAPVAAVIRGTGAWIDLSHGLNDRLPHPPFFSAPRFKRVMAQPEHRFNLTEMQMIVHTGTHVDAPSHFFSDGPAFHEIPLDRLIGRGVVWRIEKDDYGVIEAHELSEARPQAEPGDIVVVDCGWSAHFETHRYERHPQLSLAAAQWLVARKVKMLAVDFATPDLAVNRRPADFCWPVHHELLGHGVLIAEHLTNLRSLASGRAEFFFAALNIEGADGAPARVLGRRL